MKTLTNYLRHAAAYVVFIALFLLLPLKKEVNAQLHVPDSIALVDMYEFMGGGNWPLQSGWLSQPFMPAINLGWQGVWVSENRVRQIYLSSNNLIGYLPPSISNLTGANYIDLTGNHITGNIPDGVGQLSMLSTFSVYDNLLTGIPLSLGNRDTMVVLALGKNLFSGTVPDTILKITLSALSLECNQFDSLPPPIPGVTRIGSMLIYNNKFHFDDIEPWMGYVFNTSTSFEYSPQDSVCEAMDTTVTAGSAITLSSLVGGSANVYMWFKNGFFISSSTNPQLTLTNVNPSHAGNYSCRITNALVPNLTLHRRHIFLSVDPGVAVEEPEPETPLVYWNSTTQTLYVSTSQPTSAQYQCRLYDLQGRIIQQPEPLSLSNGKTLTIDGSSLPSGIYVIHLFSGNKSWTRKVSIY